MSDLRIFSAESMTEGQPDKLCDLISDRILDEVLADDRFARIALDAMAAPGLVLLTGQLSTKSYIDLTGIVRQTVADVGYSKLVSRFDADSIAILTLVEEQSPDVALVVDKRGAGNQGIVVGYATNEGNKIGIDTELMPVPIWLAHKLSRKLTDVRKNELADLLRPDGHSQVTLAYNEEDQPLYLYNVTVSNMHDKKRQLDEVKEAVKEQVIRPVLDQFPQIVEKGKTTVRVNPGGAFTLGGPLADTGLSGRKTISDTYGTACANGGSALSGKDPTKTDRSATYMARYIAKNIVAAELADKLEVRIAYLFGIEEPLSLQVDSFGTGKVPDKQIAFAIRETFDMTTPGIIETLNLRKVKYTESACYGAFGRSADEFPWETTDMTEKLREVCG